MVTANASPRALKLPVGFAPSSFTTTFLYRRLRITGVHPSPKVTGSTSGNTERYRHIPPHAEESAAFSIGVSPATRSPGLASRKTPAPPAAPRIALKSYRTYRDPAHFAQTVCGCAADTVAPHREHSKCFIFGIPHDSSALI